MRVRGSDTTAKGTAYSLHTGMAAMMHCSNAYRCATTGLAVYQDSAACSMHAWPQLTPPLAWGRRNRRKVACECGCNLKRAISNLCLCLTGLVLAPELSAALGRRRKCVARWFGGEFSLWGLV